MYVPVSAVVMESVVIFGFVVALIFRNCLSEQRGSHGAAFAAIYAANSAQEQRRWTCTVCNAQSSVRSTAHTSDQQITKSVDVQTATRTAAHIINSLLDSWQAMEKGD